MATTREINRQVSLVTNILARTRVRPDIKGWTELGVLPKDLLARLNGGKSQTILVNEARVLIAGRDFSVRHRQVECSFQLAIAFVKGLLMSVYGRKTRENERNNPAIRHHLRPRESSRPDFQPFV